MIRDIISSELNVDQKDLHDETLLRDDLGADSLDITEIVMECERDYRIMITDEEAEQIFMNKPLSEIEKFLNEHETL